MKRVVIFLLMLLGVGCSEDNSGVDLSFSGHNYISINGSIIGISLTKSNTYYPVSLASDSYNLMDVNIDPDYIFSIDDVEYENADDYQLNIEKLDTDIKHTIKVTNRENGDTIISYLATLPESSLIGDIEKSDSELDAGFYYVAYNNSIFKMSTTGEVVYYRLVNDSNLFNRTEIDGVVYYSYLEEIISEEYGDVDVTGSLRAQAIVMDEHYQEIDVVTSIIATDNVGALPLDNHQFEIIDLGHYLISAYNEKIVYDIPNLEKGVKVIEAVIQEIKDGELLFHWESSAYPRFYDSYNYNQFEYNTDDTSALAYDYMHFNCVKIDPSDNNFVVSFRAQSSIVKLDRETGEVIWTLGGVDDDFNLEGDAIMCGQHDVCAFGDGVYTIFNNNFFSCNGFSEQQLGTGSYYSGPIKYTLDETNKTYTYERYEGDALAFAEGSAQELSTGHYVVCWGLSVSPNPSEYIFTEQTFKSAAEGYGTDTILFGLKKADGTNMDSYKTFKYSK